MRKTAENYFHGDEGFNCAQAVLKAFQGAFSLSDEMIAAHKVSGGGRVENNECGALYAARLLVADESKSEQMTDAFVKAAGSASCKEIRQLGKLNCRGCVGEAAANLQSVIND